MRAAEEHEAIARSENVRRRRVESRARRAVQQREAIARPIAQQARMGTRRVIQQRDSRSIARQARMGTRQQELNQGQAAARAVQRNHGSHGRRGNPAAAALPPHITLTLRGADEESRDEDMENPPCLVRLVNKIVVASVCCGKRRFHKYTTLSQN